MLTSWLSLGPFILLFGFVVFTSSLSVVAQAFGRNNVTFIMIFFLQGPYGSVRERFGACVGDSLLRFRSKRANRAVFCFAHFTPRPLSLLRSRR